MQKYTIVDLNKKAEAELAAIAGELGIANAGSMPKQELIYKILDEQAISVAGVRKEKQKTTEDRHTERRKPGRPRKNAEEEAPESEDVAAAPAEPNEKEASIQHSNSYSKYLPSCRLFNGPNYYAVDNNIINKPCAEIGRASCRERV